MNFTSIIAGSCMKLNAPRGIETGRIEGDGKGGSAKASLAARRKLTKRQINELFFENCIDCGKMGSIPQAAFAVRKIRCNNELTTSLFMKQKEERAEERREDTSNIKAPSGIIASILTPLKYNSKLMNSVWGQYNRYSVHNFKKNTDAEEGARGGVAAVMQGALLEKSTIANVVATTIADAPQINGMFLNTMRSHDFEISSKDDD